MLFKVVEEVQVVLLSLVTDCDCVMSGCFERMVLSLRFVGEMKQADLISGLVDAITQSSQLRRNRLGHSASPCLWALLFRISSSFLP